eukprot:scaffold245_cov323-Prasinococcus_capsulatus_cf.AAC.2
MHGTSSRSNPCIEPQRPQLRECYKGQRPQGTPAFRSAGDAHKHNGGDGMGGSGGGDGERKGGGRC